MDRSQIAPPKMSFDGFVTGQEMPPSNTQTVRDGQAFIVLSYRHTATPIKEGVLSLGPATQEYVLEVNRGRRSRSLLDDFFGGGAELERGMAEAPARKIRVKPLPSEGRPAGFSGAIGRFSVKTTVSRTNLAAGEAITVKWGVWARQFQLGAVAPIDSLGRREDLRWHQWFRLGRSAGAVRYQDLRVDGHNGVSFHQGPDL